MRHEEEPYNALAGAILSQAVEDYRKGLKWMYDHFGRPCSAKEVLDFYIVKDKKRSSQFLSKFRLYESAKSFFEGSWYQTLCPNIPGQYVIDNIENEFATERYKNWMKRRAK